MEGDKEKIADHPYDDSLWRRFTTAINDRRHTQW